MTTGEQVTPTVGRPLIPGFGVPESGDGMLPWNHVAERLAGAENYWVATTGRGGRPHAVPVWAVWIEETLYFSVGPHSVRNLTANPWVSVHLESGTDVVIVEGSVDILHNPPSELSRAMDDAFAAKYDYRPSSEGEGVVGEGFYVLRPRIAYAWTSFPADATRWQWP